MGRPVHRRLILPGEVERRGAVPTIYVPRGQERARGDVSALLGCHLCGMEFTAEEGPSWQRHVAACGQAHLDEIRQELHEEKQSVLHGSHWDTEVEEYMQNVVGPRMRREGRMVVRPNERAGFS